MIETPGGEFALFVGHIEQNAQARCPSRCG
jgi:hypothetical protein